MSATMQTRLQPPANDPPVTSDGAQHSEAWAGYHQDVADRLDTLPAQMRKGVTDGSDAAAGDIGEYLHGSGSAALANAVVANVASVSLTAGDWDITGNVVFTISAGTHTFFGAGIGGLDTFSFATFPSVSINMAITTATYRYNVTGPVTVWVVAEAGFTGTVSAAGTIRARRMR